MVDIIGLRARRFDALYELLTGGAVPQLPSPYHGSDRLRKDVGLPEQPGHRPTLNPLGTVPADPFHLWPQHGRPE